MESGDGTFLIADTPSAHSFITRSSFSSPFNNNNNSLNVTQQNICQKKSCTVKRAQVFTHVFHKLKFQNISISQSSVPFSHNLYTNLILSMKSQFSFL